jgi:hypothetical protein
MIVGMTGCASTPVSNQAAKPVPEQRVIDNSLSTRVSEGSGEVIIKRDAGFGGSACLTQIFMDGKILAEIDPSEKFTFYPSTGEHIFSARPKGMCGGGMVETEGVVKKGVVLTYRVGYGSNGDFGIYRTAF